jgi:hypothetical protein
MQRPNAVGWGLVLFFLVGGIAFWITIPDIFIGQIWVAVSLFLAAVYFFMNKRADQSEQLKLTGIPGRATILELTQTGMYINEQPQVKLKLRVEPQGQQPYELEKRITVPLVALGALSSGHPLNVYVDRADSSKIAIDWFGGGGAAAPAGGVGTFTVSPQGGAPIDVSDPGAQQAVLQALQAQGIDPSAGTVDLRQNPTARAAVLQALKEHGVDAAHATAAADPSTTVSAEPAQTGEPLERLTKLMQLKNAQLITDEEFAEQKKRILEDV